MTLSSEAQNLLEILKKAITAFYAESASFTQKKGLEQAAVFRIGVYMDGLLRQEPSLSALNLDCEYNKKIDAAKCTAHYPNGIRPDLLVHSRGNHASNKLAVEFKGWWNNDQEKDVLKLQDLTSLNYDYKYVLGVFVVLNKLSPPEYKLFQNGAEVFE